MAYSALPAGLVRLKRLAAIQTMVLLFEDLHWIDPTSLELLSLTAELISNHKIPCWATVQTNRCVRAAVAS
jgi:predicted ATPase